MAFVCMSGKGGDTMRMKAGRLACAFALFFCSALSAQWGSGWTIPAGAEKEVNPVKAGPPVLKQGKTLFDTNCARCHGPEGKGDGKESDPQTPAADLTDPFRADLNPDGVIFHRVANGKPPAMPAFKSQMSPEQIWTVVHYVKSLRKS
jgi:mono/diheme cytochrome c family protein